MSAERRGLRRREALGLLGGGVGAVLLGGPPRLAVARAASVASASACVSLTPEVTEGPYYIVNEITRRDVTDGQKGLPLRLRLRVEQLDTCAPIAGANVEIWQANALGVYSGYAATPTPSSGGSGGGGAGGPGHVDPDNSLRYLRGHQVADGDGRVVFDTIYPGWYTGRAPHIHVKVHVGGSVVHTGQLFFPDTLSDAVYRTADYVAHGQPTTTDAEDSIYHQEGGQSAILALSRLAGGGYAGAMTMIVRR